MERTPVTIDQLSDVVDIQATDQELTRQILEEEQATSTANSQIADS